VTEVGRVEKTGEQNWVLFIEAGGMDEGRVVFYIYMFE
jgi:hypothetical protein